MRIDTGTTIDELKKQGQKIFGYYCCYVPVELLTAAHIVPYRIMGDPKEQISEADSVLESVMCPWVRNSFDQALKGHYSFLDGIIVPHACDAVQRIFSFWKNYVKLPQNYYFDVPHLISASSIKFFSQELANFKKRLEDYIGFVISDDDLRASIDTHNENRRLVQELYSLRKPDPPLVSGSEVLQLLRQGLRLPVTEFNQMLKKAIAEAKERPLSHNTERPRLIISGCIIDDNPFFSLVEECGAQIVMDDLPIGTRSFWFHVEPEADLISSLARAYLKGIRCPRTVTGNRIKPYKEELQDRFGYLMDYAGEFNAKGIILNLLHYCDPHGYDFLDFREYQKQVGFPFLILDNDYSASGILWMKTRIDAFLEMLSVRQQ
ncbi:2-hydroxyacyl-CoA dehydratase subunit D [Chloroflexota bacterium]